MNEPQKPVRAVTSASNLFRRALCPGSAALEAQFSESDNEYSVEGTMLHSLFMLPPGSAALAEIKMTTDQREALDSANFHAWDFVRQFAEDCGIPEDAPFTEHHELALMLKNEHGELFPGHADYCRVWPEHSAQLIIDAKFGFMEVEEAADNLQLASYAVMLPYASRTGVAIVQPRNFGPKKSTAIYGADALNDAQREIVRIFRESEKPDAPRNPSLKACHFCRAKTACPEYRAKFMQISPQLTAAIVTLDNDQLTRMYEGIKFAAKVADEVRDEMKARIIDGRLPGFKLSNSGTTRKVIDGVGLYRTLSNRFPEVDDFAIRYNRCLDVGWGKLEELFATLTGVGEAKAKGFVREIAAPFVEEKEKEKRILVDKPAKK